jgi:hypothetical protein
MASIRRALKKVVDPLAFRFRRRRAIRRYLKELGFEIYDRSIRLDREDLEEQIIARRHGFYDRLVRDVMERTEIVVQGLDERVASISSRQGHEIDRLQGELAAIHTALDDLRAALIELRSTPTGLSARVRRAE